MKEEEIVYSLKNKQDILNSDEYLNDKSFLLNYLKKCEEEYKLEVEKQKKYKKYTKFLNAKKEVHKEVSIIPLVNKEQVNYNSEQLEIKDYYNDILIAETFEELDIVLPKSDILFNNKLNLILIKINKDINEINELLNKETEVNFRSELINDLTKLQKAKELLIDYRDYEIVSLDETEEHNNIYHLIFVPNSNGKSNFASDLKNNISDHNKEKVVNTLNKLIHRNMPVYKRLTKNQNTRIAGISEARIGDHCRIFLDRYSVNNESFIFVIAALEKKYNSSNYYNDFLEKRVADYRVYRQYILPELAINSDDIINRHDEIFNLITNLWGASYEKTYRKNK